MGMFVPGDHQRRLQPAATRETRAPQNAGNRRGTEPQRAANLRARPLLTPEDLGRELQRRGGLPRALMRSTRAIMQTPLPFVLIATPPFPDSANRHVANARCPLQRLSGLDAGHQFLSTSERQ